MKLSKLYSNLPSKFDPIQFVDGLNVVFAEIRLPENRNKDVHNLGKTTLGRLIDFCFLSERSSEFFLFKHFERFKDFVFFLEVELMDKSFLTVRRSVEEPTKICFKKHKIKHQDFSSLGMTQWDHVNLPFERAREMFDSLLDWRDLKPWSYRKGLGYQLRSQDEFKDVFNLDTVSRHVYWKPTLAHILGFNSQLVENHYHKEDELKDNKKKEVMVEKELGGSIEDISKIEGLLFLKQQEIEKRQCLIDEFNFGEQDADQTKMLVDDIDRKIADLNERRYSLTQSRKKVISSLEEDKILFSPDEAKSLFEQAGVLFDGQIKKDFSQLIAFNKAITNERRGYLEEDLLEIDQELKNVVAELYVLNNQRSKSLSYLSNTDIFDKYKQVTNEMVILRTDLSSLEHQLSFIHKLQDLRSKIRLLTEECNSLQSQIEKDVELQNSDKNSLFSSIRLFFSNIVEEVISRKALLHVSTNREGHLEFKAEILDEFGNVTSANIGHTYRKLLCVAFDMAVIRSHLKYRFPRFIFHDGVFESLDDRKKENLLNVIHQYADLGVQQIITVIDSDIPKRSDADSFVFTDEEIVLTLHDENDQGRLFKMKTW